MRSSRCNGMVMVIVLVLLTVLGIAAAAALRLALTSEKIARNRHAQAQALNAAELALRYCEGQAGAVDAAVPAWPAPDVDAGAPALWEDAENWSGSGAIAVAVPQALLGEQAATGVASSASAKAPQCLIEELRLRRMRGADASLQAWRITARGRSPGWRPGGHGAQVWLQSVVRK